METETDRQNQPMSQQKAKIEYLKVDDLIPYARNARTHSDAQVAQIAGSIREFGFTAPVLIDANGTIVAGHGRVMAARKLEMTEVPCIRLGHLTPLQAKAYVLADNKLALNAGWDDEMLKVELEDFKTENFDLSLLGFAEQELSQIFLEIQKGETDANKEWEGMPEFEGVDEAFRKIVVSFEKAEDVAAFYKLIGHDYGDKAKSIWYPHRERRDIKSQAWVGEDDNYNVDPVPAE